MSQFIEVAAAVVMARPRLEAFLRAPVALASAWPVDDWLGICEPWNDGALRRRYREELAGAVTECDGWIDGDHVGLLRGLDGLRIGSDEDSDSLTIDFDSRVDFQLPSLIWVFTALRGMAGFMAEDDTGLVTAIVDWDDASAVMHLGPNRSSFLDRTRDAALWARARDAEFDVRCAVSDAGVAPNGLAAEIVGRRLGR
ncbi:hypothetical protein [Kitasatospora sp. NPDC057015]|uniref:hypothetical protein n=1 Tax=Kitasatospora sp. NPDC057015 TaxID=3346001 RepID=UPI003629888F